MQKLSIKNAFSFAFQAYINRPWDMFLATLGVVLIYSAVLLCTATWLVFVMGIVPSVAINFLLFSSGVGFSDIFSMTPVLMGIVFTFGWLVSTGILIPMLVLMADNIYHDRQDILSNIFPNFDRVLYFFGARFLMGLGIVLGMLFLIVPGIIFMLYSCFWVYGILLDHKTLSREGLEYSGMLVQNNYVSVLFFVIVLGIIASILRFLPIVGHAVGLIITECAWVHLYYQARAQKNILERSVS